MQLHDLAPNFKADSTAGQPFELYKDVAGQPCILYFYPKDFTPVCTLQACEFKSTFDFFSSLDIKVFGISQDTLETHRLFKETYELPFELLADPQGEIASLYNAYLPHIKFTRRITYLLDARHRLQLSCTNIFESRQGIEDMISQLKHSATGMRLPKTVAF